MNDFKNIILNILGVITTAATLVVIYFVLFLSGVINELTSEIIVEYLIILMLALSVKSFWYVSIENSIRTSASYLALEQNVVDTMNAEVEDAYDFDTFVYAENINNYNKYVSSRCMCLTVDNYKYKFRDKLEILVRKIVNKPKDKLYYANRYVRRVEYKATKIHKLSSANILTFNQSSDGLTDDRNAANKSKVLYLLGGAVLSAVVMFATAVISFTAKDLDDTRAAVIKMIMYSMQIVLAILQTVLQASANVKRGDTAYFRKLINIFERYHSYKLNPVMPKYIQITLKEVDYAVNSDVCPITSEAGCNNSEQ